MPVAMVAVANFAVAAVAVNVEMIEKSRIDSDDDVGDAGGG